MLVAIAIEFEMDGTDWKAYYTRKVSSMPSKSLQRFEDDLAIVGVHPYNIKKIAVRSLPDEKTPMVQGTKNVRGRINMIDPHSCRDRQAMLHNGDCNGFSELSPSEYMDTKLMCNDIL